MSWRKKKVLYVSESAPVSKFNKKLRAEAWEAVTKSLIPDLLEYSDIEKSYLGKSTVPFGTIQWFRKVLVKKPKNTFWGQTEKKSSEDQS